MHEKPWKEARWCNCLDAGRRRAPGVADLPGGAGRRHARDRGATARCRSTGGLPAALAGLTAGGRGLAARPDPAQRGPDGERRDPGRRGDLPQRLPGGVQPGDPRRQRGRQLRRALRPAADGDQPGHPAAGHRLVPPPDGGRVHPERLRHLALRAARSRTSCTAASRRPASSPASQAKAASPCTATSPPSSPASRPTPGAISAAPAGSSGRGSWLSIRAIIHHPARLIILQEFLTNRARRAGTTRRKCRSARPDHQTHGSMSGVLVSRSSTVR